MNMCSCPVSLDTANMMFFTVDAVKELKTSIVSDRELAMAACRPALQLKKKCEIRRGLFFSRLDQYGGRSHPCPVYHTKPATWSTKDGVGWTSERKKHNISTTIFHCSKLRQLKRSLFRQKSRTTSTSLTVKWARLHRYSFLNPQFHTSPATFTQQTGSRYL